MSQVTSHCYPLYFISSEQNKHLYFTSLLARAKHEWQARRSTTCDFSRLLKGNGNDAESAGNNPRIMASTTIHFDASADSFELDSCNR